MDVVHSTLTIYVALCLGYTVKLTGGQNTDIVKYRGEDVALVYHFPLNIKCWNFQLYFTPNGGEERPLTSARRYTRSCRQNSASSLWMSIQISFNNVTFDDAGIYTCEAMTTSGADRQKILLTVLGKPEITVYNTDYTAVYGTNVTLECIVNANGETITSIEWQYKANQQWISIHQSAKYSWTIQMPFLIISHVRKSDSKFYRCLAATRVGIAEGPDIFLNVLTMPNIIIPGYEYNAINGKSAVLVVQIEEGVLFSLSVQWEKYEEENQQWFSLENNSRFKWTNAEPSLIIDTALEEDDGKYRIICKTAYHEVKSSPIALTVYVPVKINKLETGPVTVREGDKVEIRCLVDGRPEPKVTWRLANGTTIIASSLRNVQENILILKNVTKLNEGNYTCIAHNNFSRDEFLVYLTVSGLPVFNPPNKNLTVSPLEKHVVPAVSVFVCVALIALIVVVILIRRKRQKGRTAFKPPPLVNRTRDCAQITSTRTKSTNGQKQPSSSENISCGNNRAKFYVHLSGDMTYAQVIRKSSNHIDGNKSIRDANILQSETHTDGNKSIRDANILQSETHTDGNKSNRDANISKSETHYDGNKSNRDANISQSETHYDGNKSNRDANISQSETHYDGNKSNRDANISQSETHYDGNKSNRDANISQSETHTDGNKSIRDANISQSETHTDGNKSIRDTNILQSETHYDENKSIRDGNILQSETHTDGNKSIRDANIPQSETHTDGNKSIGDTDASHVYMNINNAYADVQQRSSTISSSTCINEEKESENTQVNKTEQLNYVELEFNSLAQDESSSLGIRGSPSDTTYTEVVFAR